MFSFLLPLVYYWKTHLPYFPSFVLLLNSLVLFLAFLILKSSCFLCKRLLESLKKEGICWKTIPSFFSATKENVSNASKEKKTLVRIAIRITIRFAIYLILVFLLFRKNFNPKAFLIGFLIFLTLKGIIDFYIENHTKHKIDINGLTPGINLSEETVNELRKNKVFFAHLGTLRAEGIDEKQINLIKKYFADNKTADGVYFYQTLPFSIWIILGTFLTVLLKGSLLQLIPSLLQDAARL